MVFAIERFYEAIVQNDRELLESVRVDVKNAHRGDVVFCDGYYSWVISVQEWPIGHIGRQYAPVKSDMIAVEVATTNGTRWYGYPQGGT